MMFSCTRVQQDAGPVADRGARPFDAAADGTILGEGLGVLVLKRLDDARRDGDRVYAVIRGVGASSDGKGNAVYAPKTAGQVEAVQRLPNRRRRARHDRVVERTAPARASATPWRPPR